MITWRFDGLTDRVPERIVDFVGKSGDPAPEAPALLTELGNVWLEPRRIRSFGAIEYTACRTPSGDRRVVVCARAGVPPSVSAPLLAEVARVHRLLDVPGVPKVSEIDGRDRIHGRTRRTLVRPAGLDADAARATRSDAQVGRRARRRAARHARHSPFVGVHAERGLAQREPVPLLAVAATLALTGCGQLIERR